MKTERGGLNIKNRGITRATVHTFALFWPLTMCRTRYIFGDDQSAANAKAACGVYFYCVS